MSRIGLKPITVPKGVSVSQENEVVTVKGPKGELHQKVARELEVSIDEATVSVARPDNHRRNRSQHGLARTLIANMVKGVSEGHEKALEIHGVGYRATAQGQGLTLSLGYSHPVVVDPVDGIEFEVKPDDKTKVTTIVVKGIDKAKVGQVAADIRKARKPDPYKGKGVRYKGEVVRLRQGKRATK
jgi:large subunit ribosomal protein L6